MAKRGKVLRSQLISAVVTLPVFDEAKELLGMLGQLEHLWGMSVGGSFAVHTAAFQLDRWDRITIVHRLIDWAV
ncbi:MAG: hypothetical protein ABF379_13075 [Akkermansiaceae bacterium]